jgi:2-phospho-L-lactate guanylyltransferase
VAARADLSWTILVPLKALPAAKTRLLDASPDPQAHAALVDAIRADTLASAATAGRLLVVTDRLPDEVPDQLPDEVPNQRTPPWQVIVQVRAGLNEALHEGATYARTHWPAAGVAALVGDLPSLTGAELGTALALAAEYPRAFVADAAGVGTTLVTARPEVALQSYFGPGSAARHATIATLLAAGPGLRLDVDTATDLEAAHRLGVGPATRAVMGW